jgi:HTH-type transcriptional regulator/antitoxin HigA
MAMEGCAMSERIPAEVFPPGEFLRDELEERGWNQTEFAEIIGREPRVVNEIILGKRAVTPETATELAAALGTSALFWMNLESAYQLSKAAARPVERIAREAALRGRFPVREMIKRGWVQATKSYDELETSVRAHFQLEAIDAPIRFPHAARRNYTEETSSLQWAWIFRVNQLAMALQIPRYSGAELEMAIPKLEALMTEPEGIRHVPRILAECGVRLIIVEPIPGSKIDGVCFWINDKEPVIGLSLKSDFIDKIWFNLWHEIKHVLEGDGKGDVLIDDFEAPPSKSESECEANHFAADRCVPIVAMRDFVLRHSPMFSEKNMLGFAKIVRRHPGIVAGQIQRATERWDLFKKHQARVRQIIIQTAITDGYGRSGPANI